MDMKCLKCFEPWDICELQEFTQGDDGGSPTDFTNGVGCPACDWGRNKERAIHGNSLYSQCASIATDLLGDDIDGLISTMDDFDYMGF